MKCIVSGVLLLAVALTTGCWDTITTMRPGETIELDEMTFGDDYVVDNCQVTRQAPDGAVLISASSLGIFSEADLDVNKARLKYLNRTTRVTGNVTNVTDFRFIADEVEISFGDKTVSCELATQFTAAQLQNMLGQTVTLEGNIDFVTSFRVSLYNCSVVPAR